MTYKAGRGERDPIGAAADRYKYKGGGRGERDASAVGGSIGERDASAGGGAIRMCNEVKGRYKTRDDIQRGRYDRRGAGSTLQ